MELSQARLFFVKQCKLPVRVIRQIGTEVAFHKSMRINNDEQAKRSLQVCRTFLCWSAFTRSSGGHDAQTHLSCVGGCCVVHECF
jgi:hypothetical protein